MSRYTGKEQADQILEAASGLRQRSIATGNLDTSEPLLMLVFIFF